MFRGKHRRRWTRPTKVMLIVGVIMALGLTATASQYFNDVPEDHTHINGIDWAYETGLSVGYDDGTFRPDEGITRGQMATMFKRYYDNIDKEGANIDEIINEVANEINIDATDICEVFGFENPCKDELKALLKGDQGDPGPTGPTGVTGYTVENTEVRWGPSTGHNESEFLCPDGKVATGGGYEIDGTANGDAGAIDIHDNGPVWDDFKAIGWRIAGAHNDQEVNVKVWAACADIAG